MRILNRYIFREVLGTFLVTLFAFTGLLLTMRVLHFASLIINKGVSFEQIAMVFLAIIPTFLELALPMAALLGVMVAFARLSGDSELVIMRASGIALHQLLLPVSSFGIMVCLFAFYVSLSLKPWGYETLSQVLFDIARTRSTAGLSEGVFNQLGKITLYSESINHRTGELERVLVDDQRDETNRKVILSKGGNIASDEAAQRIIFRLYDGRIHEMSKGKYVVTDFIENNISLSPDEMSESEGEKKDRRPRELSTQELSRRLQEIKFELKALGTPEPSDGPIPQNLNFPDGSSSEEADKDLEAELQRSFYAHELELQKRYSIPLAALLLCIIALPLGVQAPRTQKSWGIGLSATVGLSVILFYYGLLSIGIALAEGGIIPSLLAVWLPNLCILLLSIFFLTQMSTERWQSIGDAFGMFLRFFLTRVLRWERV